MRERPTYFIQKDGRKRNERRKEEKERGEREREKEGDHVLGLKKRGRVGDRELFAVYDSATARIVGAI